MAEERIIITIDEDGRISASTEGFQGEVCLEELQQILGSLDDYANVQKTDEYYQQQTRVNRQTLKNQRSL